MSSTTPKRLEGTDNAESTNRNRSEIQTFVQQLRHLPDDFLRLPSADTIQPGNNLTSNLSGSMPMSFTSDPSQQNGAVNMLDITVVEANLVKNYGFLRMDCYCRIRVGHNVCETQTCLHGAKNPRWNGVFHFYLQPGIDSFHLEIFDEKQFSADDKIAWMHHEIPQEVFKGKTVERWFPLSGRLGEDKEGSILLVMSLKKVPYRSNRASRITHHSPPVMLIPGQPMPGPIITSTMPNSGPQIPIHVQPNPPPNPSTTAVVNNTAPTVAVRPVSPPRPISQSDIDQMHEMFPNVEPDVIKSILEDNMGDKNSAISALLSLNNDV